MYNRLKILFLCGLLLAISASARAQSRRDSIRGERLREVNINSNAPQKVFSGPAAVQQISAQQLKQLPTLQLSDALKYMSGVVVRDYGGTGGMKTVSVRGLGTQHTGVAYDDIAITDCQTGQIDLGKLSLENVASLSLVVGLDDHIFVPARLFSYSSLLKINTINTIPEKPFGFRIGGTVGLYGLYELQAAVTHKVRSKKRDDRLFFWNLSADAMRSKGNYPYTLHYGGVNDSVSHEIRQNAETKTVNSEFNAVWQIDRTQRLNVKLYYYGSARELPSATIFYNAVSHQKLWNQNAFGQAHYHKYFNDRWAYQANAKFNYDYTRYYDPDYLNAEGFLDNRYHQHESYLSNTVLFTPIQTKDSLRHVRQLQFALAQDVFYQQMRANSLEYAHPGRLTSLTSLSGILTGNRWKLNANLLLTYVNNIIAENPDMQDYTHLSPALGASFDLTKTLHLRFFYKNIFRMPTFNDLYYREVGNVNLNPEKTHQWNLGLVLKEAHLAAGRVTISTTLDGYFNIVKDKIVAFPSRNLFSWTMLNYGKVFVAGAELNTFWQYRITSRYILRLNGNVTYQKAIDRTDPGSKTYNHQIPYTPLWSGSASLSLQTPWITVTYALIGCDKRYSLSQNIPANEVPGYVDQSITLSHNFNIRKSTLGLKLELLNIANKHYEIIRNYPMQGFGLRFKVNYSL
ncbi:MAG: TonB-dependent receptor [Bacteroidales bacterium]|nr:TonB-dependent receptor [Bacteroidales bacterium]